MKTLLFLCGPNGIGKTTICNEILERLPSSAYVDSEACRRMNPFELNDGSIPVIAKNISDMIGNYMRSSSIHTVIFSYGFHGRRKEVFNRVMKNLSNIPYTFVPYLLWCSEKENIRRMTEDGRDPDRMLRTVEISRNAYDVIDYPKIDVTLFSAAEAAELIISKSRVSL